MLGRRLVRVLVVGALAAALAGALALTQPLRALEETLQDVRFDVRGDHPADDVVVVGIDSGTLAALGRQWPYPRALHAQAIRALRAAGARTIAYDIQFAAPSDRPAGDRALLAEAAKRDVILGATVLDDAGRPEVVGGVERFEARGGRVGIADFPADARGGFRTLQGRLDGLPHLAVLAAGGDPDASERPIDFAGRPGTVREIPFADVVDGRFDPAAVRDKVVVVGATAPVLQDLHPTLHGDLMSGPEVHANAIQTVLDGYPLRDAAPAVAVLLVLAAAFAAPLAALTGRLGPPLLAGALGTIALLVGAQLAFDAGTIVPVAAPLLALALGTLGAVALTYAVEVRARRQVRTAFERFVPPAIVDEVVRREGVPPRRVEATVLFCDLRGFTSLAEALAAEQVIAALNRYLDLVSGAIFDHGGTVVSYQGDGVLAVFGAPIEQSDHARRALAAARAIVGDALPAFNRWLADEGLARAPLRAGVGLNTGPVMAGSVGSSRRIEYAAVGDATNVAARLQALSRDSDRSLFVSATTHAALGADDPTLERFGDVQLAGRREPVTVYVG